VLPNSVDQLQQLFDGGQDFEVLLLGVDVVGADAQVLQLADRVVRRQPLGEGLERFEPGAPVTDFVVREQRLAPEGELALQIGARRQHTADQLGDGFEQLLDRLFRALAWPAAPAGRQAQQFEQERSTATLISFGRFDVLELLELFEANARPAA
jgi:hypothetical protein